MKEWGYNQSSLVPGAEKEHLKYFRLIKNGIAHVFDVYTV